MILSVAILLSCESDEFNEYLIDSYSIQYIDLTVFAGIDPTVYMVYSGGKISKRIGGLLRMNPASGYDYSLSKNIYDRVTYGDGVIEILTEGSFEDFTFPPKKNVIYLDKADRIIRKIINESDTIDFSYNIKGQIAESQKKNGDLIEISKYYWNSRSNLDSIVTVNELSGRKKLEIFKAYDNAPNPLKNLIIFEETFYRALSKNNYKKYERKNFDSDNNLIGWANYYWTFTYNMYGYPTFNIEPNFFGRITK